MERDSLSDDDDDSQALVPNTKSPRPRPRPRSAFEISDSPSRLRRPRCSLNHLLLLVAIPALVLLSLLLFFTLRPGPSPVLHPSSPTDLMRESELRALFLLRNQQTLLLRSWNRSLASIAAPSPSSSSSPTPGRIDDFRSVILEQIKLNKQIQNALLSSHRPANTSITDPSASPDPALTAPGICEKIARPDKRRAIEWRPRNNRYLFAICVSGQMSNHLICLEKHMFVAALLDRALVLPSPKFDYDYGQVLDIKHINDCFGRKVVFTFTEFAEMKKSKQMIDRFICYVASPPCYLDDDHVKKLKGVGVSVGKIEAAWPEDAKLKTEKKRVAADITGKFASNDEVIAVGEMFYADLEEEWVMQPGGPLAHKCKTVIQPSRLIILTAQRFVQTFLGSNFVALHFRRHGFLKFWYVELQ